MIAPPRPTVHALFPARPVALAAALLGVALGGCASAPSGRLDTSVDVPAAAAAGAGSAPGESPLAGLARGGGLVFPVQQLELAAGVTAPAGGAPAALRAMDGEITFALDERGLSASVSGPAVAERMARTNPTYAGDPRALPLAPSRQLKAGDDVGEPLASQLRAVAALADRRHVVVPLALRVEPVGAAAGDSARATLRVALVDVRLARVLWTGATSPVEGTYQSGALAPRVAARFADLFAAPSEP